ncbi:hypothetical protein J3R83DRAFT_5843 [Lanmaoa asiatica]|nr:hypothetical protein J3R83DRAFT_5843 [Lanmaoa asiatica]
MSSYTPKDIVALLAKIPAIPARQRNLAARLKTLLDRSPRSKILSVLKYAACIVFLINLGSLPFVWHIRVLWPVIMARLRYFMLHFKLVFTSKKERTRALIAWAENLSPVGVNPFQFNTVYKRWTSFDDLDMFGMHLSNSSYAKARLFPSRGKALVECFPAWLRSGGQVALGATHYHFIREIPPLTRYEVRLTVGSWGQKWLYVVARYVTRPSRRNATDLSPQFSIPPTPNDAPTTAQNGCADIENAVAAIIHTDNNGTGSTRRTPIVEPDGVLLHCVAVSQICFKLGRITIPPAVILASEGFTKPYGDGDSIDRPKHGHAFVLAY